MLLKGKKILLGITGGIAAYKSAFLVRLLVKEGAEVRVLMTRDSTQFISPLTMSTLSKNPVYMDFVKNDQGEWNNHVELGLWGDLLLIAPATANTLGKLAQGLCDNLLLATYLSARCPTAVAPAMDLDMYIHPSVKRNLLQLKGDGVKIIDAESGELASGLSGQGRMAEPENIINFCVDHFKKGKLSGKKAVITAGPTQEPLDPVRYITNYSSGKMGYAIADELKAKGCDVTVITGPVSIPPPNADKILHVQTAQEMLEATKSSCKDVDIIVLCAAVSDYRPKKIAPEKIKKKDAEYSLELEKTADIAATLGKIKRENQLMVGFALETENEEHNALKKMKSKNLDMIVLNSLKTEGAGFGHDTNKITIFDNKSNKMEFELKSKPEVAKDIVNEIINHIA